MRCHTTTHSPGSWATGEPALPCGLENAVCPDLSGSDLELDCQLRMKTAPSVWSSLICFLISRKEGLIFRWHMGATEAGTESSGCEQWLSLVELEKMALFYLIGNLVIGNIDLPNDLFHFVSSWEYLGEKAKLGTHPTWVRKILIFILSKRRGTSGLGLKLNLGFIFLGNNHSTDNKTCGR